MRLFSVTFITKDTRLGTALVALEGLAYGKPEITPIAGAKVVKGNKVRGTGVRSPIAIIDVIVEHLNKQKGRDVYRSDLKRLMQEAGGNPVSVGSLIQGLKQKGIIKGKGTGTDGYKITGSK